jgi:hypothetical protein
MTLLPENSGGWGGLLGRVFGVAPTGPVTPAAPGPDGLVPASTAAGGAAPGPRGFSEGDRQAAMTGLLNAGLATWAASGQRDRYGRSPGLGEILYTGLQAGQKAAQGAQLYDYAWQDAQLKRASALRSLQQQTSLQNLFLGMAGQAMMGTGAAGGAVPAVATTGGPPIAGQAPGIAGPPPGGVTLPATPPPPLELSPELVAMPEDLRPMFLEVTREAGLTPEQSRVYARMLGQESAYSHTDPETGQVKVSTAGARGLAQVLPGTFSDMQRRYGIEGGIDDPRANLFAGANYFREQLDEFGDLDTAVTAYHAGPQNVREGQIGPNSRQYHALVMQDFEPMPTAAAPTAAPGAVAPVGYAPGGGVGGGGVGGGDFMQQLSPSELLMLAMLPPEDAAKAYLEITKTMRTDASPAYRTLSAAEAQQYGLPADRLWQIGTRGAQAGRIVQAGQEGSSTNVTVSLDKGLQRMDIDRLGKLQEAVDADAQIMPVFGAIQTSLLSGTETGGLQPWQTRMGGYLADIGALSQDQVSKLGQEQMLQAFIANVVPRMRPMGSGASSDTDVRLFQQAVPSLGNTQTANLLIVGGYIQARQHQATEVEAMRNYLQTNGSLQGYAAWSRENLPPVYRRVKTQDDAAGLPPGTVVIYDGPETTDAGGAAVKPGTFFVIDQTGQAIR